MSVLQDLIGKRYGKLVVILRAENKITNSGNKVSRWICKCDCGQLITTCGDYLRRGHTKSCGCLRREVHTGKHLTMTRSSPRTQQQISKDNPRLYSIWNNMKRRCNDNTYRDYHKYGGKGITVCEQWNDSFSAFQEWALASGYSDDKKDGHYSLDRIDGTQGYYPENCRWTNYVVQNNNTNRNVFWEAFGETHTIADWARITGVERHTLWARVYRLGYSIEEALSRSVHLRLHTVDLDNKLVVENYDI